MKAGLMEVADIFVINKADRPGADRLRKAIEVMKAVRSGSAMKGVPAHHGVDLSRIAESRKSAAQQNATEQSATEQGATPPEPLVQAWDPPVLKTIGSTGEGVDELMEAIDAHFERLEESGELLERRASGTLAHCRAVVDRAIARHADARLRVRLPEHEAALRDGLVSPYELARTLLDELMVSDGPS
jgi:LAO/AO transport system kinase